MSDLKERLADMSALSQSRTPADALKYIMKLESENKRLKALVADVVYSTGDDPEIMAASRAEWAARALAAEAKLAKAVNALGEAIYLLDPDEEDIAKETGLYRIVTTYAELTGGKDELRIEDTRQGDECG